MTNECLQCGESRETIRKEHLFCCTMTHTEAGSEVDQEYDRHRFRPYTEKELAAIKADEDYYIKQMGEMADFFTKEMEKSNQ